MSCPTPLLSPADRTWDSFLESTHLGQFQQTSKWARVKAMDGWHSERKFIQPGFPETGGFQLLWKQSRLGRIGYISKGPVLSDESPEAIGKALSLVRCAVSRLRLRALILQPPDASAITVQVLSRHGFSSLPFFSVISATVLVDLQGGGVEIEKRMGRTMRREVRAAVKSGVFVLPGRREDLRLFFRLMESTCRRQNTTPNPLRPESLEALWDEFSPNVRLSFARVGGEVVAGLLLLGFGNRITFWKKGWSSKHPEACANAFLNVRELLWAGEKGYRFADFLALDRDIAERLVGQRELTPEQQRSRHMFNLKLGGRAQLLPSAYIYVANPLQRVLFNLLSRSPARSSLQRLLHLA